MQIKQLTLLNYKNIQQAEISFSPKINCFIGENGAGKTNILDALYMLSYCKSHRTSVDSQNILHGFDFFVIQGEYLLSGEREESIYCGLKKGRKKQFKRNKKEYQRLAEHIGILPLVLISPYDHSLINDGSEERRKFVDGIISQYDPQYLHYLLNYNVLLHQRNAALKAETADDDLLDVLDQQMSFYVDYLYEKRCLFIEQFLPIFQSIYDCLSSEKEKVSLCYVSQRHNEKAIDGFLLRRNRDRAIGYTTFGSHKDDLEMLIDDFPIKRVGSQGQNKTYLVALKLAQFEFMKKSSNLNPLLLLDDIFDKLDSNRVRQIIKLVNQNSFGQIFITDTNREHIDEILHQIASDAKIFSVKNGAVEEVVNVNN